MKLLLRLLLGIAALAAGTGLRAAEKIPPAPPRYFNDYAGTVSAQTTGSLNAQLEQYERESSNQLLVAIYPHMESDSSVEDYTVRVAQAWKVGQKGKNNGAVLFVFKNDHKFYFQVGYGLEPTLTDAATHDIGENILTPRFRQGNFDAGLREAVAAMIAATKGEYRGTGRTRADDKLTNAGPIGFTLLVLFAIVFAVIRSQSRGTIIGSRRRSGLGGIFWTGGGGGGGGWSSGGGGGFSGGGGSFGGGGSGGSW